MSKEIIGEDNFIMVYIDCTVSECIKRDPKGLYKRALNGEIQYFTGLTSPYEAPEVTDTDIYLNTTKTDLNECVDTISVLLKAKGIIK